MAWRLGNLEEWGPVKPIVLSWSRRGPGDVFALI